MKSIENVYKVNELIARFEQELEASAGELTPALEAQEKEIAKIEHIESLANWYLRTERELAAAESELKPLIKELQADLKYVEQRRDYILKLIEHVVAPGPDCSFVSDKVNIYCKETTSIDVLDPEKLPIDFQRIKTEANREAIEQAFKEGKTVIGAIRRINYHLQVKHAGPRAKKNAAERAKAKAKKIVDLTDKLEG